MNSKFMFIRMLQLETFPNRVYPDPIHKGTHQVSWHKGEDGNRLCLLFCIYVLINFHACFLVNVVLVFNSLSMLLDFVQGSRFGEANVDIKVHRVHSLVLDDTYR